MFKIDANSTSSKTLTSQKAYTSKKNLLPNKPFKHFDSPQRVKNVNNSKHRAESSRIIHQKNKDEILDKIEKKDELKYPYSDLICNLHNLLNEVMNNSKNILNSEKKNHQSINKQSSNNMNIENIRIIHRFTQEVESLKMNIKKLQLETVGEESNKEKISIFSDLHKQSNPAYIRSYLLKLFSERKNTIYDEIFSNILGIINDINKSSRLKDYYLQKIDYSNVIHRNEEDSIINLHSTNENYSNLACSIKLMKSLNYDKKNINLTSDNSLNQKSEKAIVSKKLNFNDLSYDEANYHETDEGLNNEKLITFPKLEIRNKKSDNDIYEFNHEKEKNESYLDSVVLLNKNKHTIKNTNFITYSESNILEMLRPTFFNFAE